MGGEKDRGQTDRDGDRGCGCGRTQLLPIQHCQLTTVGHGHSRDLKPATEASQEELKSRGAEEELTGHSARDRSVKAQLLKSLGSHSVSDPTTHRLLRLSRGGRQLNESVGISPTKSNPSPVEVPRGRGRPPGFQAKLTRCNMAARIRWMDSTSSGLKPMILIASITAWWLFSSLSKA